MNEEPGHPRNYTEHPINHPVCSLCKQPLLMLFFQRSCRAQDTLRTQLASVYCKHYFDITASSTPTG